MRRTDVRKGSRLLRKTSAALVLVALAAASCGGKRADERANHGVRAEGLGAIPYESLQDWVSYADAVVVARVTGESEVPPTKEEVDAGEGVIGRRVGVDVEQVVWRRDPPAPTAPDHLTFDTWGWAFKGDARRPMGDGSTRLEVGHRYLMPIANTELDGWSPINPATVTPYEEDHIVPNARVALDSVSSLEGQSIDAIHGQLEQVAPYPEAVANGDLGPMARAQAVADAGGGD